ncbi:MAG TPA: glycosyltransferase family 4 protein [Thermoguttaceae bacterium]|nr:glycosyltransferase family 4 protein [Thermoguttaceae bacterium]
MKHVVIINHNAGAPQYGPNYRSYYVARSLAARGFRATIVASSFSHKLHTLPKVEGEVTAESIDGVEYLWLRGRPFRGLLGRLLDYYAFARRLRGLDRLVEGRPDVVICSSPPPFWVYSAHRYARRFAAKLVFEARDLWPQVVLDTVRLARLNPLTYVIAAAERFAYRRADAVVSVSAASKPYMTARGLAPEKFFCIPNGLDLRQCETSRPPAADAMPEDVRRRRPDDWFRLGYVGAFGKSYGLQHLIRAASLLAGEKVSFVLVGDGPMKRKMQEQARGLPNVVFVDRVPKGRVPDLLADLDACFAGFLDRPAFRYGGNQNKIYDYMAAAKPVISAINSTFDPVSAAGCGLSIAAENPQAIAEAVMALKSTNAARLRQMGENGRRYVQRNHDYEHLGKLWADLIESL